MELQVFDYLIFGTMVIGSGLIGIYYGCIKKSQTIQQYLIGDQYIWPVIMSVVVTFTTPQQMLADPSDIVMQGTQFSFGILVGQFVGCVIFIIFFLPVQLSLTGRSLLEYFERRLNKRIRVTVAVIILLEKMATLPILIYLPSLVIDKLLGVPSIYTSVVMVSLCLFYTSMGGLSAVLWTDTLQYIFYFLAVVVCLCLGVSKVGGITQVFRDDLDGERIEYFNFGNYVFHDRVNIYSTIGVALYALSIALTNQSFYQRLDCIRRKTDPRKVIAISYCGTALSRLGATFTGLIIYSYFKDCNPLLAGEIKKPDQIVPYFVLKMSETVPGLLGLFSSGVVAASLRFLLASGSTMSTGLNTIASSVHDDLVLQLRAKPLTPKSSFLIMQSTTITAGLVGLSLTPLLENVVSFQQVIVTVGSMTAGSILGVFISCMVNPWVNCKGLVVGAVSASSGLLWMSLSQRQLFDQGKIIYYPKFLTASGCNQTIFDENITNINLGYAGVGTKVFLDVDGILDNISAISYSWYVVIGATSTVVISGILSWCTGVHDSSKVEPCLIIPQLRWMLPDRKLKYDQQETDEEEAVVLH